MARIRSVYPGLFVDDAFMELSFVARILLIGIWIQCDDHGVFEFRPKSLKAAVFPGDDGLDMDALLKELVEHECIRVFDIDGKAYGAARNFCKYQHPKKPTYYYPVRKAGITDLPSWVGTYVAFGAQDEEDRLPTNSLKEKEKEKEREKKKPKTNTVKPERESPGNANETPSASPPGSLSEVSKPILKEVERNLGATIGTPLPEKWTPDDELCEAVRVDYGLTDDDIRTELTAFHAHHAANGSFSANWRASFQTWCKRWKEHRDKQAPPRVQVSNTTPKRPDQFTADEWSNIAGFYSRTGVWQRGAGGEPGQLSCVCPPDILEKHNVDPKTGERKSAPRKVATA